jgi:hypothetical protein
VAKEHNSQRFWIGKYMDFWWLETAENLGFQSSKEYFLIYLNQLELFYFRKKEIVIGQEPSICTTKAKLDCSQLYELSNPN